MASIFSKIIAGEIPSYKVAETDNCYAFLDIRPLKKGHTLVVPKVEVDKIYDLDTATYQELQALGHELAKVLQKTIPCVRVAYAVLGLEVPHAHLHLIPIDREGDLNFGNPRVELTPEEFQDLAEQIHQEWQNAKNS